MVLIKSKARNDVVRGQSSCDKGRGLDTLNIDLLVLVALLRHLADDVEVLALLHLLVKCCIDLHWDTPC